jgi:7-carboxy-7-deazaguanine synthase
MAVASMINLNDIYPSIQGEGCLAGTPMVIIRTQGCGVGCPWCDTKETWVLNERFRVVSLDSIPLLKPFWGTFDEFDIAERARAVGPAIGWVLLTGGEPAEQVLGPLVDALHAKSFRVAIETSGTAMGHSGASIDWVCVSPKIGMPGQKLILVEAVTPADEIKMVVGKQDDIDMLDGLLAGVPGKPGRQICLQPVSQQAKATELCYRTCLERGWRLSLQLHKFLDKP